MQGLSAPKSIPFIILLLASEILYVSLLRLDASNGLQPVARFLVTLGLLFVLYAVAAHLARRLSDRPGNSLLPLIACGAVLFRVTLLPSGLPHDVEWTRSRQLISEDLTGTGGAFERFQLFDSDVWRYLWDGHVSASGLNPWLESPASEALDRLADPELDGSWSAIRDNINYPGQRTVYPPLAQGVFLLSHSIAPGSVLALKTLVVLADLGAAGFLLLTLRRIGEPPERVLLYAWNPLVIKVFAGSGHVDAVAVLCLAALAWALAAGKRRTAAVAFALGILAKLFPVLLAPFVIRRIGWRNTALLSSILVAGFLPLYEGAAQFFSSLQAFSRYWRFNNGPWQLLELVAEPRLAGGLLLSLIALLVWRDDSSQASFFRKSSMVLGTCLIFSPAVMPWYLTMVLPFAILARQDVWLWFSALICFAFHVMIDQHEHRWVLALEYIPVFAFFLWQARRTLPYNPRPTRSKYERKCNLEDLRPAVRLRCLQRPGQRFHGARALGRRTRLR